jgi:hypothetical protein
MKMKRQFVAYFYFQSWTYIQLGFHICLDQPNIEIHIPFGFFRIGLIRTYEGPVYKSVENKNIFGIIDKEWEE